MINIKMEFFLDVLFTQFLSVYLSIYQFIVLLIDLHSFSHSFESSPLESARLMQVLLLLENSRDTPRTKIEFSV